MGRRAARRPGAYFRHLSVNFGQLHPPWDTRAERANALLAFSGDSYRQRQIEADLAQASADGIDETRLCEALCTGILDFYGELTKSRSTSTLREMRARTAKLRRKVLPLLEQMWRWADPDHEVKALTGRLAVSLKESADSGWTWFAKADEAMARRQSGNPFERVASRTRQRLSQVGVTHPDDQTDWLRAVRLINAPNETLTFPSRPIKIVPAPWLHKLRQRPRPLRASPPSRKKLKK